MNRYEAHDCCRGCMRISPFYTEILQCCLKEDPLICQLWWFGCYYSFLSTRAFASSDGEYKLLGAGGRSTVMLPLEQRRTPLQHHLLR